MLQVFLHRRGLLHHKLRERLEIPAHSLLRGLDYPLVRDVLCDEADPRAPCKLGDEHPRGSAAAVDEEMQRVQLVPSHAMPPTNFSAEVAHIKGSVESCVKILLASFLMSGEAVKWTVMPFLRRPPCSPKSLRSFPAHGQRSPNSALWVFLR